MRNYQQEEKITEATALFYDKALTDIQICITVLVR
jgi:hypothetical protein